MKPLSNKTPTEKYSKVLLKTLFENPYVLTKQKISSWNMSYHSFHQLNTEANYKFKFDSTWMMERVMFPY